MIFLKSLVFLLLIQSSFSQVMERPAGKIQCQNELMRCTYLTQNISARTLMTRIEAILKPGDIILPSEGYINVEGNKILSFWFFNEDLKARFEGLLPLMDVLEDGVPSHLVQFTTEIYSLSSGGLRNLEATLSHANRGDVDDGPIWDIINNLGVLDLSATVGSKLLSGVLGSSVTKSESSRVTKVIRLIPNLADLSYSRTFKVYVSPTAGVVKEEQAGLKLEGNVSINGSDPDLVVVNNFSFEYGVHNPAEGESEVDQVNILKVSNPELYLYKGVNTLVVSSQTTSADSERRRGILSFGSSRTKTYSKLMVVTRAQAMTFEDYRKEMTRYRDLELYRTFDEAQVEKLPDSKVSAEEAFKSLKPYAYMTTSGDRILGFKLDPKLASKDIIKKDFEIKISGGGIKVKENRSIENLMLSGFKLPEMSGKYLDKSTVKLKISYRRVHGRSYEKVTLYYDPKRNLFME